MGRTSACLTDAETHLLRPFSMGQIILPPTDLVKAARPAGRCVWVELSSSYM